MKKIRCFILAGLFGCANLVWAQNSSFSFDSLFTGNRGAFDSVIRHKEDYRLQIIYTRIDRDRKNHPHLTTYKFDADKYYYYCASMVKLPACALALEKLHDLAGYHVNMFDSLAIDSFGCPDLNPTTLMLGSPWSCIAEFIKEMLLVSNNYAFNPVYDFLGQAYFQDRLQETGCPSAIISHRFAACDTNQNRLNNGVSLYDRQSHQLKYTQNSHTNTRRQVYPGATEALVGKGYVGGNQIVMQPKDFHFSNYIPLSELHNFLTRLIFPETQNGKEKLRLTKSDYQYLYKCMGLLPRESAYPQFDPVKYPDNYVKYFERADSGCQTMPAKLRIFNKVGQAYGFMTDCSYVADTLNKVEFFLSCSMYLNADGILNDGIYEYNQIGYPFFHELFNAIYASELKRPRKFLPKLQFPDFSDTLLVKPAKAAWLKIDTNSSLAAIESVLCDLADAMLQSRKPLTNTGDTPAKELFGRNLIISLNLPSSFLWPFDSLKKRNISILYSSDKHFRVFSWLPNSDSTIFSLYQLNDGRGHICSKSLSGFTNDKNLPALIYTNTWQIKTKHGPIYLLLGHNPVKQGEAEYLQAYEVKDGALQKLSIFGNGKSKNSELVVRKNRGNEHIRFDPRSKSIYYPESDTNVLKARTRFVKLKFRKKERLFRP